jgi:hypothetical protein
VGDGNSDKTEAELASVLPQLKAAPMTRIEGYFYLLFHGDPVAWIGTIIVFLLLLPVLIVWWRVSRQFKREEEEKTRKRGGGNRK